MQNSEGRNKTSGRPKRLEEETDLIIFNPLVTEQTLPSSLLWTKADLKKISRAIVGVYGWHTDRVYPNMLEKLPEIVRYAGDEAVKMAARQFGGGLRVAGAA